MHNPLNLGAGGPQKSTPGATPMRYEQETEAAVHTSSQNWAGEDWRFDFCCNIQMVGSDMYLQAAADGVMVWHTSDSSGPAKHHLQATAYLSIVADRVHH